MWKDKIWKEDDGMLTSFAEFIKAIELTDWLLRKLGQQPTSQLITK